MELYLIRHGLALEASLDLEDKDRPLTEKGQQKTARVAQRLQEIGVGFDLILSSPLLRAKQTAKILMQAHLSPLMQEFQDLAPGGNLQNWLQWLAASEYNQDKSSLALVGHQPDLGNWASLLVWGQTPEKLILKKTGIIGLELPAQGDPRGESLLFLLTAPKWL